METSQKAQIEQEKRIEKELPLLIDMSMMVRPDI